MKATKQSKSMGASIVAGLKDFREALKHGRPVEAQFTVRRFELRLEPGCYDAKKVKQTRQSLGVSQVLFARLLGVSVQAVRSWEQAENVPSSIACRFMDELRHDPAYWRRRITESIVPKNAAN
ncbi:MAG: helix-turn-helix domain-containing protein [Gemmataceae bacterium]